jgi:hypothetical protein|tara:strand:+ start:1721 stop:1888 length:168 start_codon:yes stop_codon:yes gene_type:complete
MCLPAAAELAKLRFQWGAATSKAYPSAKSPTIKMLETAAATRSIHCGWKNSGGSF